jgi:hypothetical protein
VRIACEPPKNLIDGLESSRFARWKAKFHEGHETPVSSSPLLVRMNPESSISSLSLEQGADAWTVGDLILCFLNLRRGGRLA